MTVKKILFLIYYLNIFSYLKFHTGDILYFYINDILKCTDK